MSCTAPDLGEEGSHEDCPYKREEEGSHEDCAYGELAQVANLRYRPRGISMCTTFCIQAHAAKALETIRRASFSSHSRRVAYGLSLQ